MKKIDIYGVPDFTMAKLTDNIPGQDGSDLIKRADPNMYEVCSKHVDQRI